MLHNSVSTSLDHCPPNGGSNPSNVHQTIIRALRHTGPLLAVATLTPLHGDPAAPERARWIAEDPEGQCLGILGGADVAPETARALLIAALVGDGHLVESSMAVPGHVAVWAPWDDCDGTPTPGTEDGAR